MTDNNNTLSDFGTPTDTPDGTATDEVCRNARKSASNDTQETDGAADDQPDRDQTGNDEYGTPLWLINRLHRAIGGLFDCDVAAGAEPTPIADMRWTVQDDAFDQDWTDVDESLFMNPPFSDPLPWFQRLTHAVDPKDPTRPDFAVALSNTNLSSDWAQNHVLKKATCLAIPDSRIDYVGATETDTASPSFPTVISLFGDPPSDLIESLAELGRLLTPVEAEAAAEQQLLTDLVSDGGAVTALPVSPTAPTPAPTDNARLDLIRVGETLELILETDLIGMESNADIPDSVAVTVIDGAKRIDTDEGTITIGTTGITPDGTDVCVQLRDTGNSIRGITASMALGMDGWQPVPVKRIQRPRSSRTPDRASSSP